MSARKRVRRGSLVMPAAAGPVLIAEANLQVAARAGLIAGAVAGLKAEAAALSVKETTRLCPGLAVDDPQALPRDRVEASDGRPQVGPQRDALAPGAEAADTPRRLPRAEQLLYRQAERPGERERDPQRRVGVT
jgi:hypothetical protein